MRAFSGLAGGQAFAVMLGVMLGAIAIIALARQAAEGFSRILCLFVGFSNRRAHTSCSALEPNIQNPPFKMRLCGELIAPHRGTSLNTFVRGANLMTTATKVPGLELKAYPSGSNGN
jgi:hypothetical protein